MNLQMEGLLLLKLLLNGFLLISKFSQVPPLVFAPKSMNGMKNTSTRKVVHMQTENATLPWKWEKDDY